MQSIKEIQPNIILELNSISFECITFIIDGIIIKDDIKTNELHI